MSKCYLAVLGGDFVDKRAQFFIDDVIWLFRDLARERPASIYDNAFMAMLKKAHDTYGLKVQLNVFYRTSFWYNNDEFCLTEMPDCYKGEFEAASDWLKFGFHSKEEFPDYPFLNADYDTVDTVFKQIKREVVRFAGEAAWALSVVPHWAPMSREGIMALRDNGIKVTYTTHGIRKEWNGDAQSLPYGHAMRLLHNRKPETGVFTCSWRQEEIADSICGYNHVPEEVYAEALGKWTTMRDEATGMRYTVSVSTVLNLTPLEEIEASIGRNIGDEYISIATHEQYFYEDYFAYQPDYAEKLFKMGDILHRNGYRFVFAEELAE